MLGDTVCNVNLICEVAFDWTFWVICVTWLDNRFDCRGVGVLGGGIWLLVLKSLRIFGKESNCLLIRRHCCCICRASFIKSSCLSLPLVIMDMLSMSWSSLGVMLWLLFKWLRMISSYVWFRSQLRKLHWLYPMYW